MDDPDLLFLLANVRSVLAIAFVLAAHPLVQINAPSPFLHSSYDDRTRKGNRGERRRPKAPPLTWNRILRVAEELRNEVCGSGDEPEE